MSLEAETTNLLSKWGIEILMGMGVIVLGLLRWIGKGALQDIKFLKSSDFATKTELSICREDVRKDLNEYFSRLERKVDEVHRRIDEIYINHDGHK